MATHWDISDQDDLIRYLDHRGLHPRGLLSLSDTLTIRKAFRKLYLRKEHPGAQHKCPGCSFGGRAGQEFSHVLDWDSLAEYTSHCGPVQLVCDLPLHPMNRVVCFPEFCSVRAATLTFDQVRDFNFGDEVDLYWVFPSLPSVCIVMTHEVMVGTLSVGIGDVGSTPHTHGIPARGSKRLSFPTGAEDPGADWRNRSLVTFNDLHSPFLPSEFKLALQTICDLADVNPESLEQQWGLTPGYVAGLLPTGSFRITDAEALVGRIASDLEQAIALVGVARALDRYFTNLGLSSIQEDSLCNSPWDDVLRLAESARLILQ